MKHQQIIQGHACVHGVCNAASLSQSIVSCLHCKRGKLQILLLNWIEGGKLEVFALAGDRPSAQRKSAMFQSKNDEVCGCSLWPAYLQANLLPLSAVNSFYNSFL